MAPIASQVLFAAGGDVLSKYGTLIWRKGLQTRGGEIPYTFTRTGNGLYLANDVVLGGLKVLTAGSGLARVEQLVDPVNGVLQSYLKLEAAATNSCLQSQAGATTPWSQNLLTPTNNAGTAPDGTATATKLVPTAVSSADHAQKQSITITAGEYVAVSCFFAATGYTGAQLLASGASGSFGASIDLTAGTITALANTGTYTISGQAIIALGGGNYWCGIWGKTATDVSAQHYTRVFDTGAHALSATAFTGDAASGIYWWGAQLERNGTANALPPSSYIATTVGTATRNVETFTVPYYIPPTASMWFYLRMLERGNAANTGNPGVLELGSTDTDPRFFIDFDSTGKYRVFQTNASGGQVGSNSGVTPTFNQAVEILALANADGSVQIKTSVNGAADVAGAASGALTLPTNWNGFTLQLGARASARAGTSLFSRALVGRQGTGPLAVSQIADVRGIL